MNDALGAAGAALVIVGVGLVNVPAAMIVAGVFCLAAAVLLARRSGG